jgi:hypothetical protein
MTPALRSRYFRLYAAACAAQGWDPRDEEQRHSVTLQCMQEICAPARMRVDSITLLGDDEITALLCNLEFLGSEGLEESARWLDCKQDYRAFNRARQADWHERKAYGAQGSGKLKRNRFAGAESAEGEALDKFDPAAITKRHLTMVTRNQQRTGYVRRRDRIEDVEDNRPVGLGAAGAQKSKPLTAERAAGSLSAAENENPF